MGLNALVFSSPLLLWVLLALPVLWILLRSVPPAPTVQRFPAIGLLLGLEDEDTTPAKTPWWLLMLRMLALSALIIGLAGPSIDPEAQVGRSDRLAVLVDASWASSQSWSARQSVLDDVLKAARADGKAVALIDLSQKPNDTLIDFAVPETALIRQDALRPNPWRPDYVGWADILATQEEFDTIWFSDGLDAVGKPNLEASLASSGRLTVYEPQLTTIALSNPRLEDGTLLVSLKRPKAEAGVDYILQAIGPDPAGITRVLAETDVVLARGELSVEVAVPMQTELRNRVERLQISGIASAGSVALTDSSLKRKRVGLYTPDADQESSALVSPLHYLKNALIDTSDTFEADLLTMIEAGPDVIILADMATFAPNERIALENWVTNGGVLVRFAGPRLAAAGTDEIYDDPLLPVQLRAGGREVGGAMSWGSPRGLQEFPDDSPFFGLAVPEEVLVTSQVLAQPDPELGTKTLASLQDGTPLVTRDSYANGRIILFHVTANAEWSNLPISVLFVQMLERLSILASVSANDPETMVGRLWSPDVVLDGFGEAVDGSAFSAVEGERFLTDLPSADLRPGVYSNEAQAVAFNAVPVGTDLKPARWAVGTDLRNFDGAVARDFKPVLLSIALGLLMIDIIASLWLQGTLWPRRAAKLAAISLAFLLPFDVEAQTADPIYAANNTVLAYVLTGDSRQDRISEAGLRGLSAELTRRTSVEPAPPVGLDLENDPLELYSFIYWPIVENQRPLSDVVSARLNSYLRTGGMILFDTRDANLGRNSTTDTINGNLLRQVASSLAIPPLEPIPEDHVLTRTFYLLQDFPGRYFGSSVWVEAAPADSIRGEGMPFRNLNDGVSPIVLGGNDWASAWAIDRQGNHLRPVGRGSAGNLQREFAYRFGVNLIMYVLTGNYKSDQVHVPALLQRLGN